MLRDFTSRNIFLQAIVARSWRKFLCSGHLFWQHC